jgi:hypothetical protein
MRVSTVHKRLTALENTLIRLKLRKSWRCRSGAQITYSADTLPKQLQELAQEAARIQEHAEAAGDNRTALACIGELRRIVELGAKLRGELDDRNQTNIVSVQINSDTAKRIAETYLARHNALELESK